MHTYTEHAPRVRRRASTLAGVAVLTLPLLAVPSSALATPMTVASGHVHISDDGQCSLREAIANAQADDQLHADCPAGAGADVITLEGGTYQLHSGRTGASESAFVIATDVTLVGAGSVARLGGVPTVLDAGGAMRHFEVTETGTLQLVTMQLVNGDIFGVGGAVDSEGTLNVDDVRFVHNDASDGGAIWSDGTLTVSDSVFSDNSASGSGAVVQAHGNATLARSSITGNDATGLAFSGGAMSVTKSTISANVGTRAGGIEATAGAWCQGPDADSCVSAETTVVVRDSTISGNTATGTCDMWGICEAGSGGIRASEYDATQFGSTSPAVLELLNVTVVGNDAEGAQVRASGATVRNTVIAGAVTGPNCDETDDVQNHERFWAGDHNVSDDSSCSSAGFTQVADALLGPLSFNGGPTATHVPHPGGPLVDAGDGVACSGRVGGSTTDQRGEGYPRTVGDVCDIGAVEADADDLIGMLVLDVQGLAFHGGPAPGHEGLRTSLLVKLGAAGDAVGRGEYEAAEGQLGAFTDQVEAYAGGPIMERDAHRLITGAQAIVALFPEGTVPPDDN